MLEEDPTARSTMSIEHDDSDEYHQSKKRMHSVADEESVGLNILKESLCLPFFVS